MRVLLIYPLFPPSFWSFEKALALVGKKSLLPPLGLITVAAILPQEWELKLVDCNVRKVTEPEWDWAELVILSGMIVQKEDLLAHIHQAKQRLKRVAVGGPYPTALPEEVQGAGADYLVLDEGEITLPMLVAAIERGETNGTFRATEKPAVTDTPIPRYDLLELDAYNNMSVQFSRGCPFQCEFCDIIVLYGRRPRTKTPAQLLGELEFLYDLGWRGPVFMVDDNFIGNKRNVKLLLEELKVWMAQKSYPFNFFTEASVNLAQEPQLMQLMVDCNFKRVFLGIETPDEESLALTQKFQNTRNSLSESVEAITQSGLQVMSGFIIGFDGEKPGAGERIVEFVEQTAIPIAMFSMLQALPHTALWHRLERERRLLTQSANINQTTLMNFVPTRPISDIAGEYLAGFWQLYEPKQFFERTGRYFLKLKAPKYSSKFQLKWQDLRALLVLIWRQGVVRPSRFTFWSNLGKIIQHNPGVVDGYLKICAEFEHFFAYRQIVRQQISEQLGEQLKLEQKPDHQKEIMIGSVANPNR